MLFDADGEGTISVATFRVSTEHNIFQSDLRSYKNKHLDFQTHFNPSIFFQVILKEIDETFSDEELDGICSDVSCFPFQHLSDIFYELCLQPKDY